MKTIILCCLLGITILSLISRIANDLAERKERKNREWFEDYMNNGGFERDIDILGRELFDNWDEVKGSKVDQPPTDLSCENEKWCKYVKNLKK